MIHVESFELAGQTVMATVDHNIHGSGPHEVEIEDWWDFVSGVSWMFADGNPAALWYAMRSAEKGLPIDDEVVYGHLKPSGLGILLHTSEIKRKEAL